MDRGEHFVAILEARRVFAQAVAHHRVNLRLVEERPMRYPVGELAGDGHRVFGEPIGDIAIPPAAAIL